MATAIETLKSYFKNGKKPTEQEFGELIDAFVHRNDHLQDFIPELAEISEAEQGVVNDKYMSPFLTKLAIYALTRLSDIPDLEAEVNTKNDAVKAALRGGIASGLDTLSKLHTALNNAITAHAALTNNPHNVTKAQVGLGNLPNAKSDSVSLESSNILATSKAVKQVNDRLPAWIENQRDVLHVICAGTISGLGERINYWGEGRVNNNFPFHVTRVSTGTYYIYHHWGSLSYGFIGSGMENRYVKVSAYHKHINQCHVFVSDDTGAKNEAFSFIIFELI